MSSMLMGIKPKSMNLLRVKGFPFLIFINILLGITFSFVLPFTSLFGIDEVPPARKGSPTLHECVRMFFCLYLFVAAIYIFIIVSILFFMKNGDTQEQSLETQAKAPSVPLSTIIFQPYIFSNLVAFTFIKAATTIGS